MLTDDTVLCQSPEVRGTDLADLVVLSRTKEQYVGLRDVGARVWTLLATPTTVRDLVATLISTYDVSAEQCRGDVLPFLESLVARGLVQTGERSQVRPEESD